MEVLQLIFIPIVNSFHKKQKVVTYFCLKHFLF